jgi:NAD(P)-dependent dehydrogenase (short-subunit alcohol dehydrogenase family)
MLTRYLAKECGPEIRVNAICPGTIDGKGDMREIWNDVIEGVPLRRVGAAAEVVGAALLLASPAGSYITGQTIFVDGGRVATVG